MFQYRFVRIQKTYRTRRNSENSRNNSEGKHFLGTNDQSSHSSRLRREKESLESLLRSPTIEPLLQPTSGPSDSDSESLSESDRNLWDFMQSSANVGHDVSTRINYITAQFQPTLDKFTDTIHKMDQYRASADQIASRTLAICAEKLSERDKEGRRRARQEEENRSPRRDLSSVLRSLAQAER